MFMLIKDTLDIELEQELNKTSNSDLKDMKTVEKLSNTLLSIIFVLGEKK